MEQQYGKELLNGVVLLDLRKAFDLVDTDVLLHKLSLYQCDDLTIDWFKSYLQGRGTVFNIQRKPLKNKHCYPWCASRQYLGSLLINYFYE